MTTSRSLLLGFLILFTGGSLADTDEATVKSTDNVSDLVSPTPTLAVTEQKTNASTPGENPDVSVAALKDPKLSTEPLPSTSSSKDTTETSKLLPKQTDAVAMVSDSAESTTAIIPVSRRHDGTPFPQPANNSVVEGNLQDASDTATSTAHATLHTTVQTIVRQKYPVTTGKKTPPEKTATLHPTLKEMEEETEMTTEPVQYILDNITIGTTVQNPVTVAVGEPKHDTTGANSQGKSYLLIILAVAFCILCLVAFLVFMYRRHRHRSGSTNFNQAGWAGQVALPDDSALDRDIEAEAVAASGDGEARRSTLVTFFGKRQSRLPSVAMEDISGKKEREECQQLLNSDTGPEGSGEANGKLSEPTKEVSEKTSTLSKPEQGSS
ncbi:leukosialin [Anolis carolinensis]|uniref:leukosialin n=1 Tax=Anolis carolinensis TaxID=28377 RepID=UPI002F2B6B97